MRYDGKKNVRVLLINPPFQRLKGIAHIYMPIGLGYLCSYISKYGRIDASIYNAEVPEISEKLIFHMKYQDMLRFHKKYTDALYDENNYIWKEARKVISDFGPDFVCLTVMTAKYDSALNISKIAKSVNGNCKVVWGGPHPTIDPDGVLRNSCVDFAVRGEGEATLKELIDTVSENANFSSRLEQIDGLSYKSENGVKNNPDRKFIEDLDALPLPAKDKMLYRERYLPSSWGDIITLRGCPFRCGYCGAHNIWTRRVRHRKPKNVIEEMRSIISKYDNKEFYFWDDNFTLDRQKALKICGLIKSSGMRISWGCTTRVDLLDDEIIREMKSAGCNNISIGIESGSRNIVKKIHKDITMDMVTDAVRLLDKHDLKYEAFFMIGFPEETKEDLDATFDLMKRLTKGRICFSIFTPYPGTEQYDVAKNCGLLSEAPDWSRFSHQSVENHFMKNVNEGDFKAYTKDISAWIDERNARNIAIEALLWNTCLNIRPLIKNPRLIINKIMTFFSIIKNKLKIILRSAH